MWASGAGACGSWRSSPACTTRRCARRKSSACAGRTATCQQDPPRAHQVPRRGRRWQDLQQRTREAGRLNHLHRGLAASPAPGPHARAGRLPARWTSVRPASRGSLALAQWRGLPHRDRKRAGHSVEVLLRVYAKCVHGQDEIANRRIEEILWTQTQARTRVRGTSGWPQHNRRIQSLHSLNEPGRPGRRCLAGTALLCLSGVRFHRFSRNRHVVGVRLLDRADLELRSTFRQQARRAMGRNRRKGRPERLGVHSDAVRGPRSVSTFRAHREPGQARPPIHNSGIFGIPDMPDAGPARAGIMLP